MLRSNDGRVGVGLGWGGWSEHDDDVRKAGMTVQPEQTTMSDNERCGQGRSVARV
jgi:hypothetical protein